MLKQANSHLDNLNEAEATVPVRGGGYRTRRSFRALRNRDFRLYLFGLIVSQIGTYMQLVAESWLVYRLTNSAFTLGVVGFVSMIPLAPLTLVAGALADRFSRRTILTFTQIGQLVPPLVLAGLVLNNQVQVWQVVVIDLIMGAMAAIDQPTRQALIADATPSEDLDSAIALNATGFSAARVIGPAIAGLLVAGLGEAACFIINGLSFLAVAVALAAMRLPPHQPKTSQTSITTDVVDSGRYLLGEPIILTSISIMVIINLFLVPYQTLLPVFARDFLEVGAIGLGLLAAMAGVGAIIGSLGVAYLPAARRGIIMLLLGLGASLLTIAFAVSRNFAFSCLLLILLSGAIVAIKVQAFATVHARVRNDLRGRVMSVVVLFDAGVPRLGGLGAGFLATSWGASAALGLSALGCLGCIAGLSAWMPQFRKTT